MALLNQDETKKARIARKNCQAYMAIIAQSFWDPRLKCASRGSLNII